VLSLLLTTLPCLVPAPQAPAQADLATFTLEQASRRDKEHPVSLSWTLDKWSWAADGKTLRKGSGESASYFDAATGTTTKEPAKPIGDPRQEKPAGKKDGRKERIKELKKGGQVELLDDSPDGATLAFIRDYDLYVAGADGGEARALTTGGSREFLNGKLDWVYQEEVYGRGNFKAFWWSPSGKHIAYLALDESNVIDFTVVDHIEKDTFQVKAEITRYPKVGDPNPITKVGIVDVATGVTSWMDVSAYPEDFLAVRVDWTLDGSTCLVSVQDRVQTWAELVGVNPATGEAKTWIREESPAWVERPSPLRWLEDGSFLWASERTGYNHLYHYDGSGKLLGALTQGEWALGGVLELDEEAGSMRFTANEGGDINRNVYSINLDGTGFTRLTHGAGQHRLKYNDAGDLFLDEVHSLTEAPQVRLCKASDGEVVRVLSTGVQPLAATHKLSQWELMEVPTKDGFLMDVALLRPVPFDDSRAYPVWIQTYSGPAAPTVRNRENTDPWYQFLAQNGMIVMQCNVRTASTKGAYATRQCYKQLGKLEVADMADAVDWLVGHTWADAARVGMTGYSFGGFMTASSMIFTDKYRLGISGGGVYDWRMYDSIYTERFMSTPDKNAEGYASTSCLEHAGQLTGFLHMHHGVMDDNVHLQNMMQMSYAFMKAGRTNFSMMAYPQTRHGIRDRDMSWHARQLEWELIQEHLGPEYTDRLEISRAEADFDAAVGR
jgi:dipeptidyl-peptidase-4